MTGRRLRIALLAVLVLSSAVVGHAWATRATTTDAPPANGVTVVTQQGRDRFVGVARIVAFRPDGSVLYEDDRHGSYFDVDPVAGTRRTVEYVAVEFVPVKDCPERMADAGDWCSQNLVVRTNLSTGERTVVYDRFLPKLHKIHDVDRVNDTHLLVANIYRDRLELVNTSADGGEGAVTWRWNATRAFEYPDSGGPPGDWTHLNDVELLPDGRVMISPRNHDQVLFLRPGEGVIADQTLGCDDCHGVMYEQHNPDYVPADRGGPVVVLADSENDRIVSYRRSDGGWERHWTYTDAEMAWPRDADRLPGGTTLVTDSHANRVVEIAPNGSVVWSVTLGNPYEAERLGTGDESAGGRPHAPGRQVVADGPADRAVIAVRDGLPAKPVSAALWILPYWVGVPELVALVVGLVAVLALVALAGRRRLVRRFDRGLPDPRTVFGS